MVVFVGILVYHVHSEPQIRVVFSVIYEEMRLSASFADYTEPLEESWYLLMK